MGRRPTDRRRVKTTTEVMTIQKSEMGGIILKDIKHSEGE